MKIMFTDFYPELVELLINQSNICPVFSLVYKNVALRIKFVPLTSLSSLCLYDKNERMLDLGI